MYNNEMRDWITKNYKTYTKKYICDKYNLSLRNLQKLAKELGVINIEKSNRRAFYNKLRSRDLTFDNLKEIAKLYKSRGEFQKRDASAYRTALIMGILDDICKHMISQSYSIPQIILSNFITTLLNIKCLYNTRKIIKPLELDIYIEEFRLAFEYNGKGWHKDKTRDLLKLNKCIENNITLINIIENSRNYEDDIKNQLIQNINNINNITNKNINVTDILNLKFDYNILNDFIIDRNNIKHIISKYEYYHDFIIQEPKLYNKLYRLNILSEYTSHLKLKKHKWSENLIKQEVTKYEYLKDFINNSQGCYLYICKNPELKYLLLDLKLKEKKWTEENIKNEIAKYTHLSEFMTHSHTCYCTVMKNKLNHLLAPLKRVENKWNEETIKLEISKYTTLYDFRKKSSNCYSSIIQSGKYNYLMDVLYSNKRKKI